MQSGVFWLGRSGQGGRACQAKLPTSQSCPGLALVVRWPMEGGGQQLPWPQAPGIPPVSSTHGPGPVYKAQGAKESVWPRQLSPEAQRREPKREVRLSHSMPAPGAVGLQLPEPLALDLWSSGAQKPRDLGQGRGSWRLRGPRGWVAFMSPGRWTLFSA